MSKRWIDRFVRNAGIRVREIAPDYRSAIVELRMGLFNRNYSGPSTSCGTSPDACASSSPRAETVAEVDKTLYIRRKRP